MSSILYIILGLFITFTTYFLIAWGMSSLFFWINHEEVNVVKSLKISATLAVAALLTMLCGMICFSSLPMYIFAPLLAILGFGFYFSTLKLIWKFKTFDATVISITLAIILNSAWLSLLGIL